MTERQPSPAASDSSTMSKNKNRRSKNRAQNNTSATGANALPTGGQTVPMTRAAFNHLTQPILPWNTTRVPPAFGSPSTILPNSAPATPISSFCRPVNPFSNSGPSKDITGSLLATINAITRPAGSTAPASTVAVSVSAVQLQAAQVSHYPAIRSDLWQSISKRLPGYLSTRTSFEVLVLTRDVAAIRLCCPADPKCCERRPYCIN